VSALVHEELAQPLVAALVLRRDGSVELGLRDDRVLTACRPTDRVG
jgi:hypothetical protein